MKYRNFITIVIVILLHASVTIADAPSTFVYQGVLTDIDGLPIIDEVGVTFSIYLEEINGSAIWSEQITIAPDGNGYFYAELGNINSLSNVFIATDKLYLGIKIGNHTEMFPRQLITSVPFSINSNIADGSITGSKIVDGSLELSELNQSSALIGQIIKWDGSNWAPSEDLSGTSNNNDITVIAGSGLTAIGDQDSIILGIEENGIITSMIADNSITFHKIANETIENKNISSTAQIDISKIAGAATLESSQIFTGSNKFTNSIEVNSGSENKSALLARSETGKVGIIAQSNSDNSPSLYILNGVSDVPPAGDPQGTGPLIEAWTLNVVLFPYSVSLEPKFSVAHNGDVSAAGTITGGGTDLAEMVNVVNNVEAGDVLVIDSNNPNNFALASSAKSRLVAGIYSTNPGFVGVENQSNTSISITPGDDPLEYLYNNEVRQVSDNLKGDKIPMAIVGIVPCKVTNENGDISPGDLLVTSSKAGHAMKDNEPSVGTVLGKALEPMNNESGLIKVLVTLQ